MRGQRGQFKNAVDNDYYGGFEGLSRKIEITCFCIDPSVKSSLRFLRTTPWAREKVESLYLYVLRQKPKQKT
ncbi:VF530 family DNA-binding protein [Acinetobacter schindleri]|uniref:VF530 family DNA-binding protein n=1 Tax=Acinetobacter schindleri TaxID=108981 RepID=UPI0030F4B713